MNSTIATVLILGVLGADAAQTEPPTVNMRGESFQVWPVDNLRARGFPVREIPRERNAAWAYIDAINLFASLPEKLDASFDSAVDGDGSNDESLNAYLAEEANQAAIRRAREAAAIHDCQMPYFGNPEESVVAVLLPNLSYMRFLARLMIADAWRLAEKGKLDEAVTRVTTCLEMGRHTAQGATLIESLVGISIHSLADRTLARMACRYPFSPAQLARLERELASQARQLPDISRGFEGERSFGPAVVDELCASPFSTLGNLPGLADTEGMGFIAGPVSANNDGWSRLEARVGRLVFPDRAIKAHMAAYFDQYFAEDGTYRERGTVDADRYIRELPFWDTISRAMLPSLERSTLQVDRLKAQFALARAAVALRKYATLHDEWPADLESARHDDLSDDAFLDPFTGNDVQYRRDGDGWLLYSVGDGQNDNGGAGDPTNEGAIVVACPSSASSETAHRGGKQ